MNIKRYKVYNYLEMLDESTKFCEQQESGSFELKSVIHQLKIKVVFAQKKAMQIYYYNYNYKSALTVLNSNGSTF